MRRLTQSFGAFPLGVLLALVFLALGGCDYPTEPIVAIQCLAGDTVVITDSLVTGCVDPRDLPLDSLMPPADTAAPATAAPAVIETRRWRLAFEPLGWS